MQIYMFIKQVNDELLSFACVSENDNEFYAVLTDFARKNTHFSYFDIVETISLENYINDKYVLNYDVESGFSMSIIGKKKEAIAELKNWLSQWASVDVVVNEYNECLSKILPTNATINVCNSFNIEEYEYLNFSSVFSENALTQCRLLKNNKKRAC